MNRAVLKGMAKRLLDLALSLLGLLLLSPVLVSAGVLVWAGMGVPIFYSQRRPGLRGKPFVLYKFRTMLDIRNPDGTPSPDDQRLTRIGGFLRSTSLDELPELFNVLKGDMSLVGPRPLLMEYLDRYTPQQARRHEVKPGITGWAQVNGRNSLSWADKFRLDVWYVDHWTLWLDLKILWMTLLKVARREGISYDGCATMPEFRPPGEGLDEHRSS